MVFRSDIQQQAGEIARAKAAAKECLISADKFLKDRQFDKARQQVDKARSIDPANPYISAFEERIKIFEDQQRAQRAAEPTPGVEPAPTDPAPPPTPQPPPKPQARPVPEAPKPAPKPAPKTPEPAKPAPQPPPQAEPPKPAPPAVTPSAEPHKPAAPVFDMTPKKPAVERPHVEPPAPAPPAKPAVEHPHVDTPKAAETVPPGQGDELKSKMDEMSKQILQLSQALVSERKTREEILQKQLENAVRQFKDALRKAWVMGAPKDKAQEDLQQVAATLNLDDEVVLSVTREVKLEMYGRAVKEMLAKRKLVRSSTSTMDWLRKVYQISMAEYLEYESRFLMDLVTDQFRGTLMLVAGAEQVRRDLAPRLKSSGFAVVSALSPEEALEKIERVSPTIIVTETQFPGRAVSGVMFLQLLRANPKYSFVPVILVCDEQEAVTLMSSELRPIEGVVKTPVDADEMNAIINEKLAHLRTTLSNL